MGLTIHADMSLPDGSYRLVPGSDGRLHMRAEQDRQEHFVSDGEDLETRRIPAVHAEGDR